MPPHTLDIAGQLARLAAEGSRVGAAMQEIAWPERKLGGMTDWPASLRHPLLLTLRSALPQVIGWGGQGLCFLNDICLDLLGEADPQEMLGKPLREGWPDLWALLHPCIQQVQATGRPGMAENLPYLHRQQGTVREIYLTCSCTPLLAEDGGTGGVLLTLQNTTARVLAERRLRVEEQLAQRLRSCESLKGLSRVACEVLGTDPEYFPFAILYLLDQSGRQAHLICSTGLTPETAAAPPVIDLHSPEAELWKIGEVISRAESQLVPVQRQRPAEGLLNSGPRQAMVLPLQMAGADASGALILGVHPYRPMDEGLRRFCQSVAVFFALAAHPFHEQAAEENVRRALAQAEGQGLVMTGRLGLDGRWLAGSPAFCQLLGYSEKELLGKTCREVFSESAAAGGSNLEALLAGRQTSGFGPEERLLGRDGKAVWVSWHGSLIRDWGGGPKHLFLLLKDLTREVEKRQTVAALERRLGRVLESITDGFISLDENWRITAVNGAAAQIGQEAPARVLGKKLWVHWPQLIGTPLERQFRRAAEERSPVHLEYHSRTLAKWLSVHAYPSEAGLDVFFQDITVLKREEGQKEEARRKLKLLFASSIEIMAEEKVQDLLQLVAKAAGELTGARLGTAGHIYWGGRFVAEAAFGEQGRIECPAGSLEGRGGVYLELLAKAHVLRLTDAELREHPAWWGLPPEHLPLRGLLGVRLTDLRGQAKGLVMVSDKKDGADFDEQDEFLLRQLGAVTSLALQHFEDRAEAEQRALEAEERRQRLAATEEQSRQAAAELARSNRELEQFAYVVSHDLREPLRTVHGFLDLLAKRYETQLDREGREFIRFAVDGAARMEQMIRDLLDYSRVQRQEIVPAPVDLFGVYLSAASNLQGLIEETGVHITHDPLPSITGDESQLIRLFQNLLANGLRFRGERAPRLHLGVSRREDDWLVSVRDNGIGIAPEQQDRIFQIFQRLHTQAEYPGTGMGLAICQKIVERHGGRLWVESEPGRGSTFYFTLPRAPRGERPVPNPVA